MDNRFIRNIPALSESDQEVLASKKVLIAGCGGLGGYLAEYIARLGIRQITVVDSDSFDESNINRQVLADSTTLGKSKAETAKARILNINPHADVLSVTESLNAENASEIVSGHDIVLDGLDTVESRLVLEDACSKHGIAMVHGAVHGWSFEVALVSPQSALLERLYSTKSDQESKTILSFVPPCCAAVQVSEAVNYLCNKPSALDGKVMFFDMDTMEKMLISI